MQYVQDYDETFPQGEVNTNGSAPYACWPVVIYPYVKTWNVFICPDDQMKASTMFGLTNISYIGNGLVDYNTNPNTFLGIMAAASQFINNGTPAVRVMGSVLRPAESIAIAEQEQVMPPSASEGYNTATTYGYAPLIVGSVSSNCIRRRGSVLDGLHKAYTTRLVPMAALRRSTLGLANFVFCDGHVKSMAPIYQSRQQQRHQHVECNEAIMQKHGPLSFTGVKLGRRRVLQAVAGRSTGTRQAFLYPTNDEIDYFASKGMNVIRVPFLWETLQPVPLAPFNTDEISRFQAVIDYAVSKSLTVIIDPHNYARYYGEIIGGPSVSTASFADFWARLSTVFAGEQLVWFGLVNEPHDMPNDVWLAEANAAIAAIRGAGAENLILVPGNGGRPRAMVEQWERRYNARRR